MQPNFKRFGERLDRHIKNSIYNQAEIARLIDYHPSTVNKWVKGTNRMPIKAIDKFCDLLKLNDEDKQELLYLSSKSVEDIGILENAGGSTNKVSRDVPVDGEEQIDEEEQTKIRRARRRKSILLAQMFIFILIGVVIAGLLNIPQVRNQIYALIAPTTSSDPIATRTIQSAASPTLTHAPVVTPTTFTIAELKATAQSLRVCGNAWLPNGGFLRKSPELLEEKSSQSNVMVNIPVGSNVEILCESLQRLDQSSSGEFYVKVRYRSAEGWIWIKSLVLKNPDLLSESFGELVQNSQVESSKLEETIQALAPQASIPPTPEALIDVERNRVIVVYESSSEDSEIVGLIPGNALRLWNMCGSVNRHYAISDGSCEAIFGWINDPIP